MIVLKTYIILPLIRMMKMMIKTDEIQERAMTEQQGKQIIEFIKKIDPEKTEYLIMHCFAGISRSGAVGTFCAEYFKDYIDIQEFKITNFRIDPNPHVLRILRNLHFYSNYQ